MIEWPGWQYSQWPSEVEMSVSIDEFLEVVDGPVPQDRPDQNWIVSFKTCIGESEWIDCCTTCAG